MEVDVFPWDEDGATGRRQCYIFDSVKAFMPDVLLYWWLLLLEAWVIEERLGIPAVEYSLGILTSRETAEWCMDRLQSSAKQQLDSHVGACTLSDVRCVDDLCARLWNRARPSLYACSLHVVDMRGEWPKPTEAAGVHLTGYWLFDLRMQMQLVEAGNAFFGSKEYQRLAAFVEAGEPPVYIGWGSTGSDMHQDSFLGTLAVGTLRTAGKRGVVLGSYSNLGPDSVDNSATLRAFARTNVFWAKWVPHEWLFPRCRAIVIHGGANTTAAGLRSGRPMVITPIAHDQFHWADQVVRKRVGVRTGRIDTVKPRELADKLQECESGAMAAACKDLAERLRVEDGVGNAIKVLGAYMKVELAWKTGEPAA